MAEQEEMRLVESWDELKPGVLVVVKACGQTKCRGRDHRYMLIRDVGIVRVRTENGTVIVVRAFTTDWDPHPWDPGGSNVVVDTFIPKKRLYRVVDGLDAGKDARDVADLETRAVSRIVDAEFEDVMRGL